MKKQTKMNFKPFFERANEILDACDKNELKNLIRAMAEEITPLERASFIERISACKEMTARSDYDVADLLQNIEVFRRKIEATANDPEDAYEYEYESYYDDYDDEDSLGPFEEYVADLDSLFGEAAAAFDYGKVELAREAYEKLFAILEIEDEYGRGITDYDLESVDIDETRARYIRAVYLTELPDKRVKAVTEKMSAMMHLGSSRPTLQEIIDVSEKPLPDFQVFIKELIDFAASQKGDKFDSWLREGMRIVQGVVGLEKLARKSGIKHPRAYYDWSSMLIADGKYKEAVSAAKYSLGKLPEKLPIRAAIADCLTYAAEKIGDKKNVEKGRWLSFIAKPTLSGLITLSQHTENDKLKVVMRDSAKIIKKFLSKRGGSCGNEWEQDDIDDESHVTRTLLLHSYLLGQDFENAFQLAKKDHPLGWSHNNCQPFFVACNFIVASDKSLSDASGIIKSFWDYAVSSALGYCYDSSAKSVTNDLSLLYENILAQVDKQMVDGYLPWCVNIAKRRINEIVSNTHRGAYERAAILTSVCVELFKCRNEIKKATNFYSAIKQSFPRHSAFQRELKKIFN
ncbi:MAG: hypothetical protein KAT71_06965 [Gammaproteobacteria bacterium]|nr:hypothetical protein [Gammaproteobacteria bacterium]